MEFLAVGLAEIAVIETENYLDRIDAADYFYVYGWSR
jgi:hypothetical protein